MEYRVWLGRQTRTSKQAGSLLIVAIAGGNGILRLGMMEWEALWAELREDLMGELCPEGN